MLDYKRIIFLCLGLYFFVVILTNIANINYIYVLNKSKNNDLNNLEQFLLKNKEKEKIIIFGSSVVLFGLSAKKINKELSLPAFNASSYGTLDSINDILKINILPKLTKRDTIIFSDWRWRTNKPFNLKIKKKTIIQIIQSNFEFLPNLDLINKKLLFIPAWFKNRTVEGDIFNNDYNSSGESNLIIPNKVIEAKSYNKSITLLKSQLEILSKTQANIYLSFTPIFIEKDDIDAYMLHKKKKLNDFNELNINDNIKFLDESFIFINSDIFLDNTHLNVSGRDKWTTAIVKNLLN